MPGLQNLGYRVENMFVYDPGFVSTNIRKRSLQAVSRTNSGSMHVDYI